MKKKQKDYYNKNNQLKKGILVLDNKTIFKGIGLGYNGTTTGEVCFNTSLTGYQEIIADPSYGGQLITLTYPHIGNYGINNEDTESDKIQAAGLIIRPSYEDSTECI